MGYFTKVYEKLTDFLRYVVHHSLRPEDLHPVNVHPSYVPV